MAGIKAFSGRVSDRLETLFGGICCTPVEELRMNNGMELEGITVKWQDSPMTLGVNIKPYYEEYCKGRAFDEILSQIYGILRNYGNIFLNAGIQSLEFSQIKDHIVCRLVNYEANKDLLQDVPYVRHYDLVILFYLYLKQDGQSQAPALIQNPLWDSWRISLEELLGQAVRNSERLVPCVFQSMGAILGGMFGEGADMAVHEEMLECLNKEKEPMLYVLTNTSRAYGAASALYPNILQKIADDLQSDLLMIPSSIHEWLITKYTDDIDLNEMTGMVWAVNRMQVEVEDRLADHVYIFRRGTGEWELPEDTGTCKESEG